MKENFRKKIILGDCLQVMSQIEDSSIDMVFCDLPYGTTRNKWDIIIPLDRLWQHYKRIVKDNGAIVLTSQPPFDKVLACSNLEHFRYEWIWHKNKSTGYLNAKKAPMKAHENILIFYKKSPTYNPQMTHGHKPMNAVRPRPLTEKEKETRNYNTIKKRTGTYKGSTVRYPRDVIDISVINNDDKKKFHPTQKPVELAEYFIKTYSNKGDLILDNCCGSGSTLVAAKKLGRDYIGIEKNEEYFNLAKKWVSEC